MRLKLRESVTYVPTDGGMLFRAGDSFLPVKGQGVFELFMRLRPFLDGRWTADQLLASLSEGKRNIVAALLNALTEAGLLYDTAGDDPSVLSEAVRSRYAASIRRVETLSARPFRAFAEFRRTRLLVFGSADMALSVIEAGLELGLQSQAVCAPDWGPAFEQRLKCVLGRHCSAELENRVELIDAPSTEGRAELATRFDVAVLVGSAEPAREFIDEVSSPGTRTTPLVSMLVLGDFVLVGPTPGASTAGCINCLMEYYSSQDNPTSALPESRADVGVAVGTGLLMHLLLDLRAGAVPIDEQGLFLELDLRTLGISRRPLMINPSCARCAGGRKVSFISMWPVEQEQAEFEAEPFLEFIYKRLVDPKTGLIARIDEGKLLQLPHHQSAALWYPLGDRSRPLWITEVGDNVLLARASVVRRVLEQYLFETLARAEIDPCSQAQAFAGSQVLNRAFSGFRSGVVTSGTSSEELMAESLFRALACYAHGVDGWSEVPAIHGLSETDAAITLEYLDDIGVLGAVCVERHLRLSDAGFEAFRFSYGGEPVSVVTGLAGSGVWSTGFKDLWLHVSALEANLEPGQVTAGVRFRCSTVIADRVSETMSALKEGLGLDFSVMPVRSAEMATLSPLIFTYGFISNVSATLSRRTLV